MALSYSSGPPPVNTRTRYQERTVTTAIPTTVYVTTQAFGTQTETTQISPSTVYITLEASTILVTPSPQVLTLDASSVFVTTREVSTAARKFHFLYLA